MFVLKIVAFRSNFFSADVGKRTYVLKAGQEGQAFALPLNFHNFYAHVGGVVSKIIHGFLSNYS